MRLFSPEYYALCAGGGMLAAGTTHLAITPLDVLKVNMQVHIHARPPGEIARNLAGECWY